MSQRSIKVARFLKKELAGLINQKLKDPRIGFVTITRVELSPDLKLARVYYSLLGEAKEKKSTEIALSRAKGVLKKHMASHLNMRFTPDIEFIFDDSIEYNLHLEEIFKKIKEDQ